MYGDLLILSLAFLIDSVANASILTKTYGIIRHEIIFDKNNITEAGIDMLSESLIQTFFLTMLLAYTSPTCTNSWKGACNSIILSIFELAESGTSLFELFLLHKIIARLWPMGKNFTF